VTPFKTDGSIDEERMRALVDRQINGGVKTACALRHHRRERDDD
jgi:dihydrodipicolinate synthase/N-acetylneuraminate lyase